MQVFIHCDKKGKILSVAKVDSMGEGLEHLFFLTDKTQRVIKLKEDDPLSRLGCLDIHDGFEVYIAKNKLIKKSKKYQERNKGIFILELIKKTLRKR